MEFSKLIPNIFYGNIQDGLHLFVDCLEFTIGYDDLQSDCPSCIAEKGSLAVFLFQNKEFADKDRPELRLQTDEIETVYHKVATAHPHLLHPNLNKVTLRDWGAKEFALRDASGVCIIIQQWN